ncbi:hypothetical protein FKM82_014165 [Ascaphus truei]
MAMGITHRAACVAIRQTAGLLLQSPGCEHNVFNHHSSMCAPIQQPWHQHYRDLCYTLVLPDSSRRKSKSKRSGDSSSDGSELSSEGEEGEYEVQDDGGSDLEGESLDEDEEGGRAGARKKPRKGARLLSQADVKALAEGADDIVQDLEFSDDE